MLAFPPPHSESDAREAVRGPTLFILNVVRPNVDGRGTDVKGRLILVDLAGVAAHPPQRPIAAPAKSLPSK